MESFDEIAKRMQLLAQQRQTKEDAQHEQNKVIALESAQQEIEEAEREVGFSARLLVQATLPHSKPKQDVGVFERSNGFVTVKIVVDPTCGLPYGTYPRLLLAWVTTEAVRTKSPVLEMGDSLNQFMSKLNLGNTGGPQGVYPRLRQHMERLFSSTVSATYQTSGEWQRIGFCPVEGVRIFWDPKRPGQISMWESTIRLNHTFYEEITRNPVPVDMGAIRALVKSRTPMGLDLYMWLTHRFSYLRKQTTIPWEGLQLQFGGDYKRTRAFKEKFLGHLKRVLALYPQANVEPTAAGLVLQPSKTHVPMRAIRGGRR